MGGIREGGFTGALGLFNVCDSVGQVQERQRDILYLILYLILYYT